MPTRIIRDGILSSHRINSLSPMAELFYRRLMSVVDDYGRFYANPQAIMGACWPTDSNKVSLRQVESWIRECSTGERPLIKFYSVNSINFIELSDFKQKIRSRSKFPDPVDSLYAECLQNEDASRSRKSKAESKAESSLAECEQFEIFWESYPRKKSKGDAERAWKSLKPDSTLVATMLKALDLQKISYDWTKDGGQFVPYPATWLNQKRWLDEVSNGSAGNNSAGQRTAPAATGIAGSGSPDWAAEKRRSAERRDRIAAAGGNTGEASGTEASKRNP